MYGSPSSGFRFIDLPSPLGPQTGRSTRRFAIDASGTATPSTSRTLPKTRSSNNTSSACKTAQV